MWRLNGFSSLTVLSNGVKLKNNDDYAGQTYFTQVMKLENKSYTAVVKINNMSGSAKLSFDNTSATKQLSKGVNILTFNGNNASSFVFTIEGKGSYIDIEYADLFEGSIAYNHQKEDNATALLRCRKKIYARKVQLAYYYNKSGYDYYQSLLENTFEDDVIISIPSGEVNVPFKGNVKFYQIIGGDNTTGQFVLTISNQLSNKIPVVNANVVISCEPL